MSGITLIACPTCGSAARLRLSREHRITVGIPQFYVENFDCPRGCPAPGRAALAASGLLPPGATLRPGDRVEPAFAPRGPRRRRTA